MTQFKVTYYYGGPVKGAGKPRTTVIEATDSAEALSTFKANFRYEVIVSVAEYKPAPAVNIDQQETFISSVQTDQTGGHIYNDVIKLKNGFIIRISEDGLSVYESEQADEDGIDIIHTSF